MSSLQVRLRLGIVSLALVALVVGGCSGGSNEEGASTTSSIAPPVTTTLEAFYSFTDFDPGDPGELIQSVAIDGPAGVDAWRVLYHSQAIDGSDIAVSGVVAVASGDAPDGDRPVLSWAHGTAGLADVCAPSRLDSVFDGIPGFQSFIDDGYVVVATDYEGLGTPGIHPYLVGESEGRGVLDIARAAQAMDVDAGNEVAVFGHSQGGHAALFAGQIQATYAPELNLVGVAAGAPVGDLGLLLPVAANTPQFLGYLVQGAFGFSAAYPEADPAVVLTPAAYTEGKTAIESECSNEVNQRFNREAALVVAKNPAEVPPWPELLAENTPGAVATEAPLFVFQGDADPLVPLFTSQAYVQRVCAQGVTIEFKVYPGADHGSVVPAALPDVESWITARVAGTEPVPTTCP